MGPSPPPPKGGGFKPALGGWHLIEQGAKTVYKRAVFQSLAGNFFFGPVGTMGRRHRIPDGMLFSNRVGKQQFPPRLGQVPFDIAVRKRYSEEYKNEALALAEQLGVPNAG